MSEQLFVYEEDEQGYWHNHVLMARGGDNPIVVETLQSMSWEPPAAGRFSTSAETLVEVAKKHGLELRVVERREKSSNVPEEWGQHPLVKGATGNY